MSLETNKTHLEAGSFKALKNVADVARQVMLGEEQEKLEIQELVNIISAARYLDENQKSEIIKVLGFNEGFVTPSKYGSGDYGHERKAAADKTQDPHRLQAKKAERKRKQDAEHRDEMRKKKEKMSQDDRDWAADRAAAAQAAG